MKIQIENRIGVLAGERGIRNANAFCQQLNKDVGFKISRTQAWRYFSEDPPAFSIAFTQAVCQLLNCLPNELYSITVTLDENEEIPITMEAPRHAIVTRRKGKSTKAAKKPNPKPEKVEVLNNDGSAKDDKAGSENWSKDVGPSGDIFPFG